MGSIWSSVSSSLNSDGPWSLKSVWWCPPCHQPPGMSRSELCCPCMFLPLLTSGVLRWGLTIFPNVLKLLILLPWLLSVLDYRCENHHAHFLTMFSEEQNNFKKMIYVFFFMCIGGFCLYVCLYEGVRSPETRVTDCCELSCWCRELNQVFWKSKCS